MELEDSGEKQEQRQPEENNDYSCFGEYGSRWYCEDCKNRGTCKHFTNEKRKAIYLKAKMKYKGRGKYRRKDKY